MTQMSEMAKKCDNDLKLGDAPHNTAQRWKIIERYLQHVRDEENERCAELFDSSDNYGDGFDISDRIRAAKGKRGDARKRRAQAPSAVSLD